MRKVWRAVLDAVTPYEAGKPLADLAAELGLPDLVRLSANENPLGPSPRVVAAIAREATRVHLYPDGSARALREALGRRLGVGPEQLIAGNGADELLGLLALAAFERGDEVVVPQPSFEPYATSVTLAAARVVASPLAGYETDLDDVRRKVTDRTKAVILCSPHNPAGTIIRRPPLVKFLESLGADPPLVVLDEAYCDFADDPEYPDGVALLRRHPRLIILRTFSKIAALAGLRVGYAVATTDTCDRLNRVRAPYNVNRLGQVAALAALEDPEHRDKTRRLVLEERAFLSEGLRKRGYTFPPSQANFLLVKVPDAVALRDKLLRAGLLVRDGADVGFPGHLRISVGLRETNEKLLGVL
ncbi:MAG: histidinol-phosphate transaminase [Candidatus Rokubacteria bacterium 13_2_20CM_2_70_11]|nr:MAG: histidinol-phosphate transaminase [Candidatus Rokubacteria bacterium 13_2_20CM_2_70_11]